MADEIATIAAAQPKAGHARTITHPSQQVADQNIVDRAENAIQLLSRWAGILAFVGAVAGIAWLIF
ncbi:hypothetical protein [Sphingobium ummariense]|uniref:Uncharacterized protein n=1 Tax=Sphingobium ummariense RL-3 TaxID=1346791 RepID=T0IW96_9SPHN|nr:hypothetical protein [Sphingobium ummariense]EQB30041.1 hypothetical protein M529_21935 [Sphingobium ummariense RL-3]